MACGMDRRQPEALSGAGEAARRASHEGLAALGDERSGQGVGPHREVALDAAQLVPGDGMLDARPVLKTLKLLLAYDRCRRERPLACSSSPEQDAALLS